VRGVRGENRVFELKVYGKNGRAPDGWGGGEEGNSSYLVGLRRLELGIEKP